MAPLDSTARKLAADSTPLYRTAPHNIEAEQALLGAITAQLLLSRWHDRQLARL